MNVHCLFVVFVGLLTQRCTALFGGELVQAAVPEEKFLVISAPKLSKVVYYILTPPARFARPLISRDLKTPRGVAVDNDRLNLFVCDPAAGRIYWYKLIVTAIGGGRLETDKRQKIAVNNVEARWVSVDTKGNLFYTNERDNLIQWKSFAEFESGNQMARTLYDGKAIQAVSSPGGIAADGFNLFWTNKAVGTEYGSVVKALEEPPEADVSASVQPIADNALKVYGVCAAGPNIFYTEGNKVYGVKKVGGAVGVVSDTMKQPRGCTFDGDGTVYIADQTGNAVYSMPANLESVHPEPLDKVLDFADSFGLALVVAELNSAQPINGFGCSILVAILASAMYF